MEVIATSAEIDKRIKEIAQQLIDEYRHKNPLFTCLLKGAVPFASELMQAITMLDPDFHPDMEYMRTSTYGEGHAAKEPEIIWDLPDTIDLRKRPVILIDDILDSGTTVEKVTTHLTSRPLGARAVQLVVLIERNIERTTVPSATIAGFYAEEGWLTGMGMNNDGVTHEAGRWTCSVINQDEAVVSSQAAAAS